MIENGDIFITNLERGFYGAFKVLKRGKLHKSDEDEVLLVAVLDIIDKSKPVITDKRLKNVLCCDRFFFNKEYCINFFVANEKYNKIKQYEYLGNLPLTEFEKKIKFKLGSGRDGVNGGFGLAGVVESHFGNNAFLEWRWKNEKEEYEREVAETEKRIEEWQRNQISKPKEMMDDKQFWEIIGLFNWSTDNDDEIVEPAVKHLAKMKVSDIKQFEENLAYKLYCLDTKAHAKSIGEYSYNETDDYVSVDFFLYARCKAVANGKAFYKKVLKDPTCMPKDEEFEALLGVSGAAYERKTKKDFEYSTECDYETYSNKKGWK